MASRCPRSHRLPCTSGPSSNGGSPTVWFMPWVRISYSVGRRPRLPKALQVFRPRPLALPTACCCVTSYSSYSSYSSRVGSSRVGQSIGVEPDVLVGAGTQPAREGRHVDLQRGKLV